MVAVKKKVVWSDKARVNLKDAYEFILTDSVQNPKKITDAIAITRKLPLNPDRHAPDKYKEANDGSYRAFEKYKYRIVYRIR